MTFDREIIDIKRIITTCFESKEMKDYLIEHSDKLSRLQIIDIIRGAPIPLRVKAELMKDVDSLCYHEIKRALEALDLKDNQLLLYSWRGHEWENGKSEEDATCIGPCRDLEMVKEHLAQDMFDVPHNENLWEHRKEELWWAELELYELGEDNVYRILYTYYLIADQICYFDVGNMPKGCGFYGSTLHMEFSWRSVNLNIDIPFQPGDIVTVDSRPFAKEKHVVILEVGPDCCGVQAMYWDSKDGKWRTGAVKHGSIYEEITPMVSPLYRMEKYTGELAEDEKYLEEVSHRIDGSNAAGWQVWCEINGTVDVLGNPAAASEKMRLNKR